MKLLGTNLIKYMQDLNTENYKILLRETEDLSKWRDKPYLWIRRQKFSPNWSINSIKYNQNPSRSFL